MPTYEQTVEYGGLTWTHNPEGEYGEYSAQYQGHKLTVSTDRDEREWDYQVDDDEMVSHLETREEAMDEAMEDASSDQRGNNIWRQAKGGL